jgi:hypothetical protein
MCKGAEPSIYDLVNLPNPIATVRSHFSEQLIHPIWIYPAVNSGFTALPDCEFGVLIREGGMQSLAAFFAPSTQGLWFAEHWICDNSWSANWGELNAKRYNSCHR